MMEQESSAFGAAGEASGSGLGDPFESRPIGEYLRKQRVLRGISPEELSSLTRIPLRSLERLESGQFDGETDGFVRGFVRTVATALGLDADDAIARMLHEPAPGSWERQTAHRGLKQASVGVAMLLLLIATFFVLRAGWGAILGTASTPGSREVVRWQDPVWALAEATGERPESSEGIESARAVSARPSAAALSETARPTPDR